MSRGGRRATLMRFYVRSRAGAGGAVWHGGGCGCALAHRAHARSDPLAHAARRRWVLRILRVALIPARLFLLLVCRVFLVFVVLAAHRQQDQAEIGRDQNDENEPEPHQMWRVSSKERVVGMAG